MAAELQKSKRLLLAGGGYADIPMIHAARRMGYYVISSGNRPDDLGHRHSDEYRPADFSDRERMLALAEELAVDAICPSCNDFSAISSAYVAERMGLPGHDSYEISLLLHHKDRYRAFALEHGIPTPKAQAFNGIEEAIADSDDFVYPLIVKPVDLTGGKGITRVDDHNGLKGALERAQAISRTGRFVVEEFIEGSRHGFSAFVRDGKVVFHFTDDEYYHLNPYLVSGASAPSSAPTAAVDELVRQSEKIVTLLGLKTGIFHVQFILRQREPVIIEICRRPPGDLYVSLVQHATGIDYPQWIVRSFCGDNCDALSQKPVDGYLLRHCVMASRSGILRSIEFDPSVEQRIIEQMMFWNPGDKVDNPLVAKFGIVFLSFDSQQQLVEQSTRMQTLIRADVY